MPVIKKASDLWGGGLFESCTENESLKNKVGCYDGRGLDETGTTHLKLLNRKEPT